MEADMARSQVKNILVIDKNAVLDTLRVSKECLKMAQQILKASRGSTRSARSMSENLGWWKGRIALLELLTKMKGLKYGDV